MRAAWRSPWRWTPRATTTGSRRTSRRASKHWSSGVCVACVYLCSDPSAWARSCCLCEAARAGVYSVLTPVGLTQQDPRARAARTNLATDRHTWRQASQSANAWQGTACSLTTLLLTHPSRRYAPPPSSLHLRPPPSSLHPRPFPPSLHLPASRSSLHPQTLLHPFP